MAISLEYLLAPSGADEPSSAWPRRARPEQGIWEGRLNSDAEWLAQLAHADDAVAGDALDALVRAYYTHLFASAESYVGNRLVAEEVTDAVFARVWDRRRSLSVRTTLAAYLFGAIRNAALNALAKQRFADRRRTEAVLANEPPGMSVPVLSPDADVEYAELRAMVWRAVSTLPERARAILTLRWRMQLDWHEIADALGMTANAAQVQHSRALAQLRQRLPELRELL